MLKDSSKMDDFNVFSPVDFDDKMLTSLDGMLNRLIVHHIYEWVLMDFDS